MTRRKKSPGTAERYALQTVLAVSHRSCMPMAYAAAIFECVLIIATYSCSPFKTCTLETVHAIDRTSALCSGK